MAVQTLVRPVSSKKQYSVVRRSVGVSKEQTQKEQSQKLAPAKLEAIEDQLTAQAIERHAKSAAALDHALDDIDSLSDQLRESRRRPLLLRSTENLNRIEDLMLEAVVRTHPNCEQALDRLMGDLFLPEMLDPTFIDNDFDGMG